MSLYFKDLNMPKEGEWYNIDIVKNKAIVDVVTRDNTLIDVIVAEVIEIPTPHGRLIDADELKPILKEYCLDDDEELEKWYSLMGIDDCIDDFAPTILEAETEPITFYDKPIGEAKDMPTTTSAHTILEAEPNND